MRSVPASSVASRSAARKLRPQGDEAERRSGRLEDGGRDVRVAGQGLAHRGLVAGVDEDHAARHLVEHARGGRAVEVGDVSLRHVVVPAVEVGTESQHLAPAGGGARDPEGEVGGLRPRRREPDPFRGLDQLLHRLRPAHLPLVARPEVGSAAEGLDDDAVDVRVVVSEHQGAVSPEVVDVLVPVDVPLARSFRPVDVDRVGIELAAVVGDPAREQLPCFLRQLGGAAGAFAVGGLDAGVAESFHEGISVVGSGPIGSGWWVGASGRRSGWPWLRFSGGEGRARAGGRSRPAGHGGARRRLRPFPAVRCERGGHR